MTINLYPIEDNLSYGEPRPKHYHPIIENPSLATKVTIIVRNEFKEPTGDTYETFVEQGCRNCEFGALDVDIEPCKSCFSNYSPEKPYKRWEFDRTYNPSEDIFL